MKNHHGTISRTQQWRDAEQAKGKRFAVKPSKFSIAMAGLMMLGIAIGQGVGAARFEFQAVMMGALILAGVLWLYSGLRSWRLMTPIAMVMTMILLGLFLQSTINPRYDITVAPQERVITGQVKMAEVMTKNRQRIRLHPETTELWESGEQGASDFDLRLITSRQADQDSITKVRPGDVITGVVRINPPLPQLLPGSFDSPPMPISKAMPPLALLKRLRLLIKSGYLGSIGSGFISSVSFQPILMRIKRRWHQR